MLQPWLFQDVTELVDFMGVRQKTCAAMAPHLVVGEEEEARKEEPLLLQVGGEALLNHVQ
eukprot:9477472-Pyramimonas_sp.AAC.3